MLTRKDAYFWKICNTHSYTLPFTTKTLFFYLIIIFLIFRGLFLHRLSRILKVKFNWIRVPTNEFSIKNAEPGGIIQIQVIPVGRQERIPPKATPNIDPFLTENFQRIGYDTYSLQVFNN